MRDPKDQIKERLDIVDVVREYVPLKPSGSNWKALCPFHQEKTPSFMVSPDRQSWRCFGSCAEGGDVFSFVMKKENMEFPEVLRMFADRLGIELRRGDRTTQNKKTVLLDVLDAAGEWWHEKLLSREGEEARTYLKNRGVSKEVAQEWQLGWAPAEWDRLTQFLIAKGFSLADILGSGLVIEPQAGTKRRDTPFYDRFRGRIMFPIADARGQIVGAGGRILKENSDRPEGKYINTPETTLYSKSRVLYGLHRAKETLKATKTILLVEGYMDVIASHRAGVTNAVAVSGTALTEEHVTLLRRYADTVHLRFDQDAAGEQARKRSIDLLLRGGATLAVIDLPDGIKDPGECVERDPDAWTRAATNATPLFAHVFARAREQDLERIETKKAVTKEILHLIVQLPDPVERGHYIRDLAALVRVDEPLLHEALRQTTVRHARPTDAGNERGGGGKQTRHEVLSERILALLLRAPKHLDRIMEILPAMVIAPGALRDLYSDIVNAYTLNHAIDPRTIIRGRSQGDRLAFAADHFFGSFDDGEMLRERDALIAALRRLVIEHELHDLETVIASATDPRERDAALARTQILTREFHSFDL